MESGTEAALLARYKKLCELVDDYRERGLDDRATAIVDGEMKVVLDMLRGAGKGPKPDEPTPDRASSLSGLGGR